MYRIDPDIDVQNASSLDCKVRSRAALATVCLGVLLVSLDSTSVITALPSMEIDLRLSQTDVGWVMSAFLLTYSSLRLLSGHLSDLYGHRSLFLKSLTLFAAASLAGGLSTSRELLIVARAIQGATGAVIATSALSLIVEIFPHTQERARAIAAYGFAAAGGGAGGVLLGGLLTSVGGWRWVFLADLPIGLVTYLGSRVFLPHKGHIKNQHSLDILGSMAVTASLVIATYALLDGTHTLLLLSTSAVLLVGFVRIESRTSMPVLPLALFRRRDFLVCCIINTLFSAAGAATILASLYLQLVRHYGPLKAGITFLPLSLSMAFSSLGRTSKLVAVYDIRWPIAGGLLLTAAGLAFLSRASTHCSVAATILPGLTLMGIGNGILLSPLFVGATRGVVARDSGITSGIIGTTSAIGRAIGFALLVSVAATRTDQLTSTGHGPLVSLNAGYQTAFLLAASLTIVAAVLCLTLLRHE